MNTPSLSFWVGCVIFIGGRFSSHCPMFVRFFSGSETIGISFYFEIPSPQPQPFPTLFCLGVFVLPLSVLICPSSSAFTSQSREHTGGDKKPSIKLQPHFPTKWALFLLRGLGLTVGAWNRRQLVSRKCPVHSTRQKSDLLVLSVQIRKLKLTFRGTLCPPSAQNVSAYPAPGTTLKA